MPIIKQDDLDAQLATVVISANKKYTLYANRWVVALCLAFSSGMSGAILGTFIAIWFTAVDFFAVDNLGINMFSIVYMVFFLPCSLLAVFWSERFGVGASIIVGATLNALCCWVRYAGAYHDDATSRYGIVLFGQCLAAFGQPFLLISPPRIANDWFPVEERDYWMHLMTQSNNIGGAIGTLIPAYQVFVDPETYAYSVEDIYYMLLWQAITSTGILLLTLLFVRNEPPTPPTADVEIQKKLRGKVDTAAAFAKVVSMVYDFGTLLSNQNFNVLLTSFSCILGVSWAFMAVVGQMVYPCGYDAVQVGWAGFSIGFSGMAGSFFLALVLRYFHNYLHVTKATIALSCAAGIWCLGVNKPGDIANLIAAWNVFGIFTGPLIPIVLEFATEMTYPVPGDHSAALLFTGVNWVSLSLTLGLSPLLNDPRSAECSDIVNPAFGLCLAFLLFGAFMCIFLVKDYKRLESVTKVTMVNDAEGADAKLVKAEPAI